MEFPARAKNVINSDDVKICTGILLLSLAASLFSTNQMYIENCDKDDDEMKFIPSHAHHIEQTLTRKIALNFFIFLLTPAESIVSARLHEMINYFRFIR